MRTQAAQNRLIKLRLLRRIVILSLIAKRLQLLEEVSSASGWSSNGKTKGSTNPLQNQKESYSYDPVGNRLVGPDKSDAYSYNAGNQLVSSSEAPFEYDLNGNMITKVSDEGITSYSYDYENRLTRVVMPDGTTSVYTYDPFGRRISKSVNGNATYYFYDNEDILFEYDDSGTIGNRYIHGPGIDEPLALMQDGNTYFYHADVLGSITALTDSSAKIVQIYEYDSFGKLKDLKNRIKQPYTFTGREFGRETGMYYYRARYYDPEIGRFTSFDPIVHPKTRRSTCQSSHLIITATFEEALRDPKRLNPYSYVIGNPVNLTDPSGLACGSGWTDTIVPDNFGSFDFTSACEEHDSCYGTCGSSFLVCNSLFLNDMLHTCRSLKWYPISQLSCTSMAVTYYTAVSSPAGWYAYKKAQAEKCCQ